VSQKRRQELDKEKIKKMPRKELNAEVMHCWRELQEQAECIVKLERELAEAKKLVGLIPHETVVELLDLKDERDEALTRVKELEAEVDVMRMKEKPKCHVKQ
jgi:adenylosuccinate lyase